MVVMGLSVLAVFIALLVLGSAIGTVIDRALDLDDDSPANVGRDDWRRISREADSHWQRRTR